MAATVTEARPESRIREVAPQRRRVLLVTPGYPPTLGGIESHVGQLARGLSRGGWGVTVAAFADDDADGAEEVDGITVHRFALGVRSPAYRWSPDLRRWTAEHREAFDLVHAHGYHAMAALAAAMARPPALVFSPHYHGTSHVAARRFLHVLYRPVGRWMLGRAAEIVCVSRAEANLVRAHFPALAERISIVPNGVEAPAATVQPMRERRAVVLCSGRLEPYKGVRRLVEAAAKLLPGHHVVVTGDGPEHARLEALVERLGIADTVTLAGNLDERQLRRWQRTATVYVTLSSNEAFNIAAYEAAACGARIIASDIPAHREMLTHLDPGTVALVPERPSPAALARVIEATAELGPVEHQRPLPTWADAVAAIEDIYDAALSGAEREDIA
jgi:glycosyltransferase involved in cell wall biosynthesis